MVAVWVGLLIKGRKLKNYFKQIFSATLSDVSNKTKLKSRTYTSQHAKLTDRLKNNKNKDKTDSNVDLLPISIGELKAYPVNPKWRKVLISVDSGSSASIVHERFISGLLRQKSEGVIWNTMGGQFKTVDHCKTQLYLPELNSTALINVELHITNRESKYDVILGHNLWSQLGIVIDFEKGLIKWNEAQAQMKHIDFSGKVIYNIDDLRHVKNATKHGKKILDTNYDKANLVKVTNNCKHLVTIERALLLSLLQCFEPMFDGSLGQWCGPDFKIELKEWVNPYYSRPYAVLKIHKETMKKMRQNGKLAF